MPLRLPSPLLKAIARLDLATGRWRTFTAETPDQVRECLEVLDAVRLHELNRAAGPSSLDSHAFAGEKLPFVLLGCRDRRTGRVIGCLRITPALPSREVPASRAEYHLDAMPEPVLAQLCIVTRLAVLPEYRKALAGLALMGASIVEGARRGWHGSLLSCEPGLYASYLKIGQRPIGPAHPSPSGGFRIPMLGYYDPEHMRAVRSPLFWVLPRENRVVPEVIHAWHHAWMAAQGGMDLGFTLYDGHGAEPARWPLVEGLSAAGRRQLLDNAMAVRCARGDVIIAEDDGGKGMGMVREGVVEVRVDGSPVATLGAGTLFGEIAPLLGVRRNASVVVKSEQAEVVLLSVSAFQRLRAPADQAAAWRNLAIALARRLHDHRPASEG